MKIFLDLKDNGFALNYGGTFVNFRIDSKGFFELDNNVFDVVVRIYSYLDTIDYMKFNKIKIKSTPSQMYNGRAKGDQHTLIDTHFSSLDDFEKYAPIGARLLKIEIKYDEIRY